ncbi:MAG: SDR family NAD(P)-dependent oxidoreductase [Parvibaculum sp.]|uniref:oxidoreductase n=1 Tax=Parvibaculum sp. TaxID=2024848 RepID=UPI0025D670CC|nr:oxidoreductase [Parvibaculum sp.]MCE9648397.1 SDR family NAD(P)-dependent oxidoreductase [Parvibaculum sp.]
MPLQQKPIGSPFNAGTQAGEAVRGIDLKGKTAIVTGGASGLGVETVRTLAAAGARVVMPVRSRQRGEEVAADIRASTGNKAVEVADMDLADYASVRAFADGFVKSSAALDMLINNAGIMATPERRIMGGIESQFGTNHLGHMLMTGRLAGALAKGARVVALSSIGHRRSPVKFDDPNFETTPYDKWEAYGQSKTADSLFAIELNRRLEPKGINAYAVHPGGIMTNLQRDIPAAEIKAFGWVDDNGNVREGFKTPAGGASTAVWCATSPLLAGGGGVYCEDCNIAELRPDNDPGFTGVRSWAIDPDVAKRLWALSEKMLGETFAI